MRETADIRVEELVVHMLDSKSPRGLVLSERTIDLDGNPELKAYFSTHIQKSLRSERARAARFLGLDDRDTSGVCRALLSAECSLLQGSQRLAERLFRILASDRRLSPGDLVVCFYTGESGVQRCRYLGMLKIDPSDIFQRRIRRDDSGRSYVGYEIQKNAMPTTRELLQKCAFIHPLDPRPSHDMMLLDWQSSGADREVASFFQRDFLGCEPALDSHQRTDLLYQALIGIHNSLRHSLTGEQDESLAEAIHVLMHSTRVNVEPWVEGLPLPEEAKEQIAAQIAFALPDKDFELDESYGAKLARRRVFRGDYGLKVDLLASNYSDLVKENQLVIDPGIPPYHRVVIHTERWDEVRR